MTYDREKQKFSEVDVFLVFTFLLPVGENDSQVSGLTQGQQEGSIRMMSK